MTTPRIPKTDQAKQAQLDNLLEHVADQLGDITPLVMDRFYRDYPEARVLFVDLACGYPERLEASMVESALYCVMTWFERPAEIHIILAEAVPHHELLGVPVAQFIGLQVAVIDTIVSALPSDGTHDRALLVEIGAALTEVISAYAEGDREAC